MCGLQGVSERAGGITCPAVLWLPEGRDVQLPCWLRPEQQQWAAQEPTLLATDSDQLQQGKAPERPWPWQKEVQAPLHAHP